MTDTEQNLPQTTDANATSSAAAADGASAAGATTGQDANGAAPGAVDAAAQPGNAGGEAAQEQEAAPPAHEPPAGSGEADNRSVMELRLSSDEIAKLAEGLSKQFGDEMEHLGRHLERTFDRIDERLSALETKAGIEAPPESASDEEDAPAPSLRQKVDDLHARLTTIEAKAKHFF